MTTAGHASAIHIDRGTRNRTITANDTIGPITWAAPENVDTPLGQAGHPTTPRRLGAKTMNIGFTLRDNEANSPLLLNAGARRATITLYPSGQTTGHPTITGQFLITMTWIIDRRQGRVRRIQLTSRGQLTTGNVT